MARKLRPVAHEDRLSLVEHLTELRVRLIVSLLAFCVATGVCMWQNHALLKLANRPLENTVGHGSKDPLVENGRYQARLKVVLLQESVLFRRLALNEDDPQTRSQLEALARSQEAAAAATPPLQRRRPVTLGVGEPFMETLKVSAYAGLLLSLPLLLMVPFLFIAGVVFGYFMVVPPAIRFLQNFNDDSFDVLVQAQQYYRFVILLLAAMGLLFQIPVGILGLTRVGIITTRQLSKNRRYAVLVIAVVAMVLPGQDPVTMTLMMVPMYVLFETSILLSWLMDRRARRAAARDAELVPIDPD